jgi:long-chain acyl-CoA synthetase
VPRLVHRLLASSAASFPEKTAVFDGSRTVTYSELESLSNRLAVVLRSQGLRKGDRVLMAAENSAETIASYYGVLKAGGVCVEVPDRSMPAEVSYYIANSGARICILSKASVQRLGPLDTACVIGPELPYEREGLSRITWDQVRGAPDDVPGDECSEDDLAAIVYTSGSTGKPKGVMLTHRNLCVNTASIVSYLQLTPSDRIMAVLPFHYVYGKTLLNTHVMVGGSLVINNRFVFPNAVIKDMAEKEVTGFAGVPSTFAMLLNRSIFGKTAIPSLRYVTQAGGAMAPALTRKLIDCLGPVKLFVMYGATEAAARLTYLPPDRLLKDKLGSIGIAIPGVNASIRDNDGRELPPFEVGNICASGENIMKGYWGDEEETAKALKPWGLVTGDLGHRDEEGFIFLTGRKKDMLKVGGERVSPKEIEDAIIESGLVHEAAVLGHPDELLSEVPEAFVVPLDDKAFDLEALKAFILQRLSVYKHPRFWNIMKALPKKTSGKIDKEALKK